MTIYKHKMYGMQDVTEQYRLDLFASAVVLNTLEIRDGVRRQLATMMLDADVRYVVVAASQQ